MLDSGDHQVTYVSDNGRVWLPCGLPRAGCRRARCESTPLPKPSRALRTVSH